MAWRLIMRGLHQTHTGHENDLWATNGQNSNSSGVGQHYLSSFYVIHQKAISYSSIPTITLDTRGVHNTEINKLHDRLQLSKSVVEPSFESDQLANESSFGRKFLANWSWFIRGLRISFDTNHSWNFPHVETFAKITWEGDKSFMTDLWEICEWFMTHSWVTWEWLKTHFRVTCEWEDIDLKC